MTQEYQRPLPECITRLLREPTAEIGSDRIGTREQRPNLALKIAVTWAIVYNLAGGAILFWLWSTMGVSTP